MKLLDKSGGNTKVKKSAKTKLAGMTVRYASLTLRPDEILCPASGLAKCRDACLDTSGMAKVFPSVNESRDAKSAWFHSDNAGFMDQLLREMRNFQKLCAKQGVKAVFRLNTMSDVLWEKRIDMAGEFADCEFIDYTKQPFRLTRTPANYNLMFSYSSVPEYQKQVQVALKTDRPIAVVFRGGFPKTFLGRPVIDGDESDLINVQTRNTIVALKAKGDAKNDTSGFVIDNPDLIAVA